ncbi:MAG: hypothetical protein H0W50_02170 [Parachlamydiaceae bacterium]|nr:hypothetical protein [Parachlamydiaceae bacterium]
MQIYNSTNFNAPSYPYLSDEESGAIAILSQNGFIKDVQRDNGHRCEDEETVSEVQGSKKFCNLVAKIVTNTPHALSLSCLRSVMKINEKLYRQLEWKRFAHIFSLKGKVPLPDGSTVNLEGFNDPFSMTMLLTSFDNFAKSKLNLVTKDMHHWIAQGLSTAIWHDNATHKNIVNTFNKIKDPSYCYPILMCSGWNWHSVTLIFFKNYFIYCNRGSASNGFPGWTIYHIGSKKKITKQFLDNIAKRLNFTKQNYISVDEIIKELNATELFYSLMKEQSVGNCTYSNVKAAIFALMTLWDYLKVGGNCVILNKKLFKTSHTSAKAFYKEFSNYDRQMALDNFFIDLELNKGKNEDTHSNMYDFIAVEKLIFLFLTKIKNLAVNNNIFSFGYKIGWERWLRFDDYVSHFTFCSPSDRKTLRNFAKLVNNKTNYEGILVPLKRVIGNFKSSDFVIQILEQLHKNRLATFDQRLEICSFMAFKGMEKELTLNLSRLGFIENIQKCKNTKRKFELVNSFITKDWLDQDLKESISKNC